jgi:alcohol dehydrogenase (cytochrome c)
MRVRALICAAAIGASAIGVAACGGDRPHGDRAHGDPPRASVDWPSWGNTAENTHFASLAGVNPANVSHLRLAWTRSEGPGQSEWETFPIVVGRTMYYTTDAGVVVAVDAATGRSDWAYAPAVDFFASGQAGTVAPVSRGVTVAGGRVYEVTYDDQLIALDARNGWRLWDVRIDDPARGYAENSPPAYWHGELIVGGPAGNVGLSGFVAAFDARTGRQLWRTSTILGRRGAVVSYGGGHVWMPPVIDPRSGTIYVATGNPTPAFAAARRPGCDRWTDATLALNPRTGAIEWGHSEVCNDGWDYDTDQSPALFDVRVGGRTMHAVGDGNKAGFYSTLDARTGALIARTPELVRYTHPHRMATRSGALVCPGIFGGLGYGPPAYSPVTGDVYLTAVEQCMRYRRVAGPAGSAFAGTTTPAGRATGAIAAVDPASGRIIWRERLPSPAVGGALATASGLVFAGDDDGSLYAFTASNGHVVWRADLGLRFGSAPIAYEIGGKEYIAVVAGGSALSHDGAPGGGKLFVFSLSPATGPRTARGS